MNQNPGLYYKKLKIDAGNDIVRISGKIRVIGWARFLCVLAVVLSWWLIPSAWVAAGVSLVAIGTFLVLVKRHSVLFGNKMEAYCREEYADKGLSVVDMEIDKLPGGDEFADPQHPFTYDLDVFGKRSLFSVLDFTSTVAGRKILAGWLRNPETVSEHVVDRQEAIRELADEPKLRLDFVAAACCGGEKRSGGGVVVSIFPPLVNINTLQRIYAGICPWIFATLATPLTFL